MRVTPEAYYLFDTPATGVSELCDAFKVRHMHESKNLGGGLGAKTPFGARTPARTPAPGHATPGQMSVRQVGRTPNPYGGQGSVPPATGFGGATPAPPSFATPAMPYGTSSYGSAPPPNLGGWQTPGFGVQPQPPAGPPGVHPARAAMIQQSEGGWTSQSGW